LRKYILVSKEISIWHYPCAPEHERFRYYLTDKPHISYGFNNLESMIESAYAHIDPLRKKIA